jgi:hypothetical protein
VRTAAFSVLPSTTPSGTLTPSAVTPSAPTNRCCSEPEAVQEHDSPVLLVEPADEQLGKRPNEYHETRMSLLLGGLRFPPAHGLTA